MVYSYCLSKLQLQVSIRVNCVDRREVKAKNPEWSTYIYLNFQENLRAKKDYVNFELDNKSHLSLKWNILILFALVQKVRILYKTLQLKNVNVKSLNCAFPNNIRGVINITFGTGNPAGTDIKKMFEEEIKDGSLFDLPVSSSEFNVTFNCKYFVSTIFLICCHAVMLSLLSKIRAL